jgi:hypothetical protein
MSTITEICTQIATVLLTVDGIDAAEMNSYYPTRRTTTVAAVLPPFGLSGRVAAPVGLKTRITNRIPCVLWIAFHPKDEVLPDEMTRARDICLQAAAALQATVTRAGILSNINGYFGDDNEGNNAFEWTVDENPTQLANGIFLVATLYVTVTQWVVLTA